MSRVLPPVTPEGRKKQKPSSVVFPEEMRERIEKLAKERGYSFSAAVVRLCEFSLQELERENQEKKR